MPATAPQPDVQWDREIGGMWARLLRLHRVNPTGNIAEAGPGFTLKVGYGLKTHGFRGTLYVVDPNRRILDWVTVRYRELLPEARIMPIRARLDAAAPLLPSGLDAILMNHLLDDLLLDAAIAPRRRAALFGNMHPGAPCTASLRRTWRVLANDASKLQRVSSAVCADVTTFYCRTRPRLLAASQYPSWFHSQNDLSFVNGITDTMLERIACGFGASPNRERGTRWLVLSREQMLNE